MELTPDPTLDLFASLRPWDLAPMIYLPYTYNLRFRMVLDGYGVTGVLC